MKTVINFDNLSHFDISKAFDNITINHNYSNNIILSCATRADSRLIEVKFVAKSLRTLKMGEIEL